MEIEKDHEDHCRDLERLVHSTLHELDNFCVDATDSQTSLTELCEQILKLKEEEESSIEDLKEKIGSLQTDHEQLKQQLAILEKRKETFKKEKDNIAEQKVFKSKHLKRVSKDREIRQHEVESLQRKLSRDLESQPTLDRNKDELLLYKQLTGIAWDFYARPELVKGYVSNKTNGYCKPFCYDKDRVMNSQITESLWEEINLSSLNPVE